IAHMFSEASKAYEQNPTALQLRQMNILYEGLKQKGGMMVVPSTMVDSMGPAGLMAATALAAQQQANGAPQRAPAPAPAPEPAPAEPAALPVADEFKLFGE
ncbi:MAG TPA: hypothetical protein VFQ45_19630, partial [Longimicrobium sp.]|nr:hypothetical protein [Longimicrobium sp.]